MAQKMKQKKIWIAAGAGIVLLAVIIVAAVALRGGKEPAYRSIRIVELEGSVSIDRDGIGTLTASQNMNLISGDRVTTAEHAYVVLCLDTDKYVMLGEAGAMKVVAEGNENSGKTSISLECGSVLSDIRNPLSEGSSYEIATPNATMSVRGTVFEVRKENEDGEQISVLVYDGSVAVGLGENEPVLYAAGEYTVFTDSAAPEVLVERGTVSDEVMDDKVRERLQQISTEGRTLNVGSADLSAPTAVSDAEHAATGTPTAEPATTATAMPAATPAPTATSAPTAKPVVTATPAPAATPMVTATPVPTATPVVTATPVPTATPVVTATPAPAATPVVTVAPEPTATVAPTPTPVVTATPAPEPEEEEEPEPTAEPVPTPTPTAVPTAAPTTVPTAAPTAVPTAAPAPTATPAPPQEGYFRISFEIPYVLISGKEPENSDEAERIMKSHSYGSGDVKKGDLVWKQGSAEVTSIPNHEELQGLGLEFVGWYTINGSEWNFDTYAVEENTVLYPVWKDKDGNLYKVKGSEEFGVCYSIKVESADPSSTAPSSEPSPAPSGEPAGES